MVILSFIAFFLLLGNQVCVSFQIHLCGTLTRTNGQQIIIQLSAKSDGGMDAFAAQLQAAHAEAANSNYVDVSSPSTAVKHDYSNEMAIEEQSSEAVIPQQEKTGKHAISSLLMQRAIQTQLYYLADLRDEPTYVWLREFLNHGHLDDKGRFNELDGLRCNRGWQYYLDQLEQAPDFTITVQLAPPRLSAQQQRNPYLAAQAVGRSYEETIVPSEISQTLRAIARSLEQEWVPILVDMAEADRKRVRLYNSPPQLQTAAAAYQAFWQERQVVAGGEGDDQGTPLHALNERIVLRFCTRFALDQLLQELHEEASSDNYSSIDKDVTIAAVEWLKEFSREWEPRLKQGPDDDVRRSLGIAPPGHWQRLCDGADADDVTEAMWQELPPLFAYSSDDSMRLYSPAALSSRLRRVRADVCDELIGDLRSTILAMS